MSQTTFVNGRGIVHKTSGGSSTAIPDTCLTQGKPIPYTNTGKSSDTSKGPTTVTTDGSMPMVRDAEYSRSTGDEPGTDGGILSGVNMGSCKFINYSLDVKFEGRNVCRLGDPLSHNKNNITTGIDIGEGALSGNANCSTCAASGNGQTVGHPIDVVTGRVFTIAKEITFARPFMLKLFRTWLSSNKDRMGLFGPG